MPNHCHNDLYIHGADEDVAAVLALIGAGLPVPKFDFDAVIPYPEPFVSMDRAMETLREKYGHFLHQGDRDEREAALAEYEKKWGTRADGFNSGGYEWRCANHGTKWGAYQVARRDYEGACVSFQTAWGPAEPVIVALGKLFPKVTLRLEYFERGMEFCGGFAVFSESDAADYEVAPGTVQNKWEGKYRGHRGG